MTREQTAETVRVVVDDSRLRTGYANVFQTRFTDAEVVLACGTGFRERAGEEDVFMVRLEHRLIMTPVTAARLHAALGETLAQWRGSHGRGSGAV